MKLLYPRCRAGKEIGGASRYNVFACDSCHYHFRGTHAEIAKWNRLFKQLFTFDTTTTYADRTPCPHCCGWVPICTGDDGITCMYCGQGIRTSRVISFKPEEIADLCPGPGQVLDGSQVARFRHLLDNHDLHPRDRHTFELWVSQAQVEFDREKARRSTVAPAQRQPVRPAPKPVLTATPEAGADVAWFDIIAAHLDGVMRGEAPLSDLIRDFLEDPTDGGLMPPPDPALIRRLKDPTCGGRIVPWVPLEPVSGLAGAADCDPFVALAVGSGISVDPPERPR